MLKPTPEEQLAEFLAKQTADREAFLASIQPKAVEPVSLVNRRLPSRGTIGGIFQREREKQRLSQTDLANKAGLSHPTYVSRLEMDKNKNPQIMQCVAMALALGLRFSEVVRRLEEECPSMIPPTEGPPLSLVGEP